MLGEMTIGKNKLYLRVLVKIFNLYYKVKTLYHYQQMQYFLRHRSVLQNCLLKRMSPPEALELLK